MAFWVSGRDAVSGEPGRFLSDAATEDQAREQARVQGLVPERVERAEAPAEPAPTPARPLPVPGWLTVGVGLGLLGSCVWTACLEEVYRWAGRDNLAAAVVVGLYLALPAGLIWSGARTVGHRRGRG